MNDKLIDLIKKHNVIFWDIYDTLIKRNVAFPDDIFMLVEEKYDRLYNTKSYFYKCRKKAEKIAREIFPCREVNFDEIYQCMSSFYDRKKIDVLKSLEIELEINSSIANNSIMPYYNLCLNLNKKMYIISDMYLKKDTLLKILQKCNITGFENLYVSCEERLTKWENGNLFRYVVEENAINKEEILHIGNDKKADFLMAKNQGIDTFLISDKNINVPYFSKSNNLQYRTLESFIKNTLNINKTKAYQIGYAVFGPMLYGYSEWLSSEIDNLGLKKVYFFSRDGYILKKAFKILRDDVESHYFYTSRRAVIVPSFIYDEKFEDLIERYKSWPKLFLLKDLFNRLGLNIDEFQKEINKLGLSSNTTIYSKDMKSMSKLKQLVQSIWKELLDNSQRQNKLLLKYIDQEDMKGSIALVDMGAGCSIELSLREIIDKNNLNINIVPLYFHTGKSIDSNRKSFLDSSRKNKNFFSLLRFCYMLLEVFLSAPHGTVLKYKEENNKVIQVCERYEYTDKDGLIDEFEQVHELQQGALDFCSNFIGDTSKCIHISKDIIIQNFKNFGLTPSVEDANYWGDFRFSSDKFEFLARPKNLTYYFRHPRSFFNDFRYSMWPAGFIMRLFGSKMLTKTLFNLYRIIK